MEDKIYQWKYNDDERPQGACYDCGIPYSSYCDMTIKDEDWERINPTNHKGAGLLCPTCMIIRMEIMGIGETTGTIHAWKHKKVFERRKFVDRHL